MCTIRLIICLVPLCKPIPVAYGIDKTKNFYPKGNNTFFVRSSSMAGAFLLAMPSLKNTPVAVWRRLILIGYFGPKIINYVHE